MKINKFLMATAAVAVFAAGALSFTAARAATDQLDTQANIIAAMTVACTQALNFGDVGASVPGGTVVVSTAGVATPAGVAHFGNETEGTCDVTGDTTRAYDLTLSNITVLDGPGADDMTITALTDSSANDGDLGAGPGYSAALAAGVDTLSIGGTLNVGPNQTPGAHTGTIDVTVDYQ